MRFAALGRTHWLYDAARAAVEQGHELVLVGTAPAAPEYRRGVDDFEALARGLGRPFFCDRSAERHLDAIEATGAEVAISVNWPVLLPGAVLDAFPHGVLNAHAGDLPRYRGNAAPNWAILEGDDKVVLSVHRMSAGLDEGPVLARASYPLGDRGTIADIYAFLDEAVPRLFVALLDELEAGTAPSPLPLDPEAVPVRGLPRLPVDSLIDWSLSAPEIDRLVRASSEPFAGAYTYLQGKRLTVWRARPESLPYPHLGAPGQVAWLRREAGETAILTGHGVLVLEEVETARHGRRPASEVVASARDRLGLDLGAAVETLEQRLSELEQSVPRERP